MDNNKLINELVEKIKVSQETFAPSSELKEILMARFEAKLQRQKRVVSFRRYVAIAAGILLCICFAYLFSKQTNNIENQIVTIDTNSDNPISKIETAITSDKTRTTLSNKKKRKKQEKINPFNANLKDIEKTLLGQSSNLTWQEDEDENSINLSIPKQLPVCEER